MLAVDNKVGSAYIRVMSEFNTGNIPDLAGKTVIVTGGNSGIGRSAAAALSRAGARIVLAVRNPGKGREAAREIGGKVEVRELDLADLSSVRSFADHWDEPIQILINNAGVGDQGLKRTADGFEMVFGTNHLGHFALTNLLLEHVTDRIVAVASQAERMAKLDLADPNWNDRPYNGSRAYNDSKLANLLFISELQRRLTAAGSPVRAIAAHPGFVDTNIYNVPGQDQGFSPWRLFSKVLAQGPDEGALPVLYAAVGDLPGASFTGPKHLMHMRGGAELIKRSRTAQDRALAERLWTISEQLTGVSSKI
jgi:NAD(P)-dependent dehydrogenase (short-subunit alcohol dehydrogenase family)